MSTIGHNSGAYAQDNVVDFQPGVGHNSQRNFVKEMMAAYDAIFQADADPQVTLIRLAIWRHTNWNDRTSRVSQARLKQDCSGFASESTFKRHFPEAKKAFDLAAGGGRGRSNVYAIKLTQTAAELSALLVNRGQSDTPLNKGQFEPSFVNRGQVDTPLEVNRGQKNSGQIDLETGVKLTPPSDIGSDTERETRASADGVIVDLATKRMEVRVRGRMVALSISAIAMTAMLLGVQDARAMAIAEREAMTWVETGEVPDHPQKWIDAQIRKDKISGQIDGVKLEIAKGWGQQRAGNTRSANPAPGTDERRKNLRADYKNAGLDPDDVLRMCIREKCWRRKAVGMWAEAPADAASELDRLGVSRSEWSTWTIEAPTA